MEKLWLPGLSDLGSGLLFWGSFSCASNDSLAGGVLCRETLRAERSRGVRVCAGLKVDLPPAWHAGFPRWRTGPPAASPWPAPLPRPPPRRGRASALPCFTLSVCLNRVILRVLKKHRAHARRKVFGIKLFHFVGSKNVWKRMWVSFGCSTEVWGKNSSFPFADPRRKRSLTRRWPPGHFEARP